MNINLYEIRLEESITIDFKVLDAFFFDCQCALFFVDMTNDKSLNSIKDIIPDIDDDNHDSCQSRIAPELNTRSHGNPSHIHEPAVDDSSVIEHLGYIQQ